MDLSNIPPLFPVNPLLMGTDISVKLMELEPGDFRTPFFDDAKTHRRIAPTNFDDCTIPSAGIPLRGFIFHLSHTGSTLLAQMLSALPQNRVISEAEIINAVFLQAGMGNVPEQTTAQRLQKAIALLVQPITGEEQNAFVKFTSWNIFHVVLIRSLYPDVPCIFLHRDPVHIIHSLKKEQTGFAQWHRHEGPLLASHYLNRPAQEIKNMSDDTYLSHMLSLHIRYATSHLPSNTFAGKYPGWPSHFEDGILPFLQISFSETDKEAMRQKLVNNAKKSGIPFTGNEPVPKDLNHENDHNLLMNNYMRMEQHFAATQI